ncbi:TPA: hypothetical protein ACH3X1_015000 [Trebouxia sp. C0004]
MLAAESCTLLLGEDKHIDLMAAYEDLNRKRVDLSGMHYGAELPWRELQYLNRFEEYQRRQKTSLAAIRKAYEAADRAAGAANLAGKPQYLVSYVSLPCGKEEGVSSQDAAMRLLTSVSTEQVNSVSAS